MTQEERERYGIGVSKCRWCGGQLPPRSKVGQPRKFCSEDCKKAWRKTEYRQYPGLSKSETSRLGALKRWRT